MTKERMEPRTPLWLYLILVRLGFGHVCKYDDPTHPDYIGFTSGICNMSGMHRGRIEKWYSRNKEEVR